MRITLAVASFFIVAAATYPTIDVNVTSDQCSTPSYGLCCHGEPAAEACMCNLDKHAKKQCSSVAFDYCCGSHHMCDCSKGPHADADGKDGLWCTIIDDACNALYAVAKTSVAGCTLDAATTIAACEIAGIGPEDPLADACALILGTTVEVACVSAIKAGGKFAAGQCKKIAGCGHTASDMVVV
jgi:hypothetical protein